MQTLPPPCISVHLNPALLHSGGKANQKNIIYTSRSVELFIKNLILYSHFLNIFFLFICYNTIVHCIIYLTNRKLSLVKATEIYSKT